jgi:hypothetical protein
MPWEIYFKGGSIPKFTVDIDEAFVLFDYVTMPSSFRIKVIFLVSAGGFRRVLPVDYIRSIIISGNGFKIRK